MSIRIPAHAKGKALAQLLPLSLMCALQVEARQAAMELACQILEAVGKPLVLVHPSRWKFFGCLPQTAAVMKTAHLGLERANVFGSRGVQRRASNTSNIGFTVSKNLGDPIISEKCNSLVQLVYRTLDDPSLLQVKDTVVGVRLQTLEYGDPCLPFPGDDDFPSVAVTALGTTAIDLWASSDSGTSALGPFPYHVANPYRKKQFFLECGRSCPGTTHTLRSGALVVTTIRSTDWAVFLPRSRNGDRTVLLTFVLLPGSCAKSDGCHHDIRLTASGMQTLRAAGFSAPSMADSADSAKLVAGNVLACDQPATVMASAWGIDLDDVQHVGDSLAELGD